jgi:hypothetical protein
MKKFFFSLLWECNENCLFCAKGKAPAGAKPRFSPKEAEALLRQKRKEGCEAVSLDGGEPALLSYLPRLIGAAARLGYKEIELLTNGTVLADPKKVAAIKRALAPCKDKVRFGACVSLHSHRREISESLTRSAGTFDRTVRGIRNLIAAGAYTTIYHLITAPTYRSLPAFADFAIRKFPGAGGVTFSYIYPVSHNLEHMSIYPRLSKVGPYLSRAVAKLRGKGLEVSLSNCGLIPVCLMGGCETLFTGSALGSDPASETRDTSKAETLPFFTELFNRQNKTKPPACAACALTPVCGGIWNFYYERFGAGELKPYTKKTLARLPASGGTAVLAVKKTGADALPPLLARLLDLRYRGFVKVKLAGPGAAGLAKTAAFRNFASDLGFSRISL